MAAQITENLSCPICFECFKDPKQLTCGHTFCKRCLVKICDAESKEVLRCPNCRRVTLVQDRGVTELPTNITLRNLVDDLKSVTDITFCSANCEAGDRSPALKYCQTCEVYMCHSCLDKHEQWKRMADHEVVTVDDIKSGRVKVKQKCKKHPNEDLMYTCMTCMKFVCFRCRILECDKQEHIMMEAAEYMENKLKQIKRLEDKVKKELDAATEDMEYLDQLEQGVKRKVTKCREGITKTYNEAMARLIERRDSLLQLCDQQEREHLGNLEQLKDKYQKWPSKLSNAFELVENGKKALDGKGMSLGVHEALCKRLEFRLRTYRSGEEDVLKAISDSVEKLEFKEDPTPPPPILGQMLAGNFRLKKRVDISAYGGMQSMAATPDGMMAIAMQDEGGIKVFSTDGNLKNTLMKGVDLLAITFTSNGCYTVRDSGNGLHQISRELDSELSTPFEHEHKHGDGNLSADSRDNICTNYKSAKKIRVLNSYDGKVEREIICKDEPLEICATKSTHMLVKFDERSVSLIDDKGNEVNKHTADSGYTIPAIRKDGSILIANVDRGKGGRLIVDHYTRRLNHRANILNCKILEDKDCYGQRSCLQEFSSGELAFCTHDTLFIFHKKRVKGIVQ